MTEENNQKIEVENTVTPDSNPTTKSSRGKAWLILVIFVALIIVASFVAFSGNKHKSSTNKAAAPAEIAPAFVSITPSGYMPATISIKLGQAVEWTNTDSKVHTIISDNPKPSDNQPDLRVGQTLNQNDSFTYIFSSKGSYSYHDSLNQSFHGTVVIK